MYIKDRTLYTEEYIGLHWPCHHLVETCTDSTISGQVGLLWSSSFGWFAGLEFSHLHSKFLYGVVQAPTVFVATWHMKPSCRHPRMGILFFAWAVTSWTRQVSQVNRGNKLKGSWWLRSEGPPTTYSHSWITWWIPVAPWRCEDVDVARWVDKFTPARSRDFWWKKKEAAKFFLGMPFLPFQATHWAQQNREKFHRWNHTRCKSLGRPWESIQGAIRSWTTTPARLSNIVLEDWDK